MAIEVMTAWASDPDGIDDFIFDRIRSIIDDAENGNPLRAAVDLIHGFVNLSGTLLIQRESEMHVSDIDTLRQLGLEYQTDA
ncbi:hypothetical protein ACFX43_22145 [Nocardioides sp. YIM B13467]|uniref:hypothetical protein n=1 Tax=Nocardioides sp. YIM B13467 TaxID=3366294 RepID=UPI0036715620